MGTNILIGTDLSESSMCTIETGLVWAKILKCKPIIIHIEDKKEEKSEIREGLKERLHKQIKSIANDQKLINDSYVVFGNKEERILHEIEINNAKILVLGSSSEPKIKELLIGGTTGNAIRSTPIPILAVKNEKAKSPKHLFWAMDLGVVGDFSFEWIKILSNCFQGKVTIGFIVDPKTFVEKNNIGDIDSLLDGAIREKILHYIDELTREGIVVDVRIKPEKSEGVAGALENLIHSCDCDLVIMGTSAKKGFKRLVLSSVSEKIINNLNKSIFIVKNPI